MKRKIIFFGMGFLAGAIFLRVMRRAFVFERDETDSENERIAERGIGS